MPDFLSVDNLTFTYRSWTEKKNLPVLKNLSLRLRQGEKVLVLAPFDAGKSTFARILAGLCPKYLDGDLEGSILLEGSPLGEPWDLVEKVGYVSQDPQEQFIASTVEDELAFPLESLGTDREEMHQRVREALSGWGLSDYAGVSEAQLSGGERKRVLLALTEMIDPDLWILDESFDDLDAAYRAQLSSSIRRTRKTVLVLASRNLGQFSGLFDRILLLKDGALIPGDGESFRRLAGDDQLAPLGKSEAPGTPHTLEAEGIAVLRSRVSDMRHQVFSLSVPRFRLESGRIVTLIGDNGSGKSTFARLLCGLDLPSSGSFSLDGKTADRAVLERSVGYLFQNPDFQIFLPTVRDELSWSLTHDRSVAKGDVEGQVEEAAELFGLDPGDTPTTMSYPKRKALQAAVYWLLDRPFYILDELDNALTYASAQKIVRLLRERGSGILVITHDPVFARLVAEKGWRIRDGKMEAEA